MLTHLPFAGDSVRRFELDGWQARTAKEMARRASWLSVESWLAARVPCQLIDQRDGVLLRVFPAQSTPFGYSRMMQRAAEALPADAVLHLHGSRSIMAYSLMSTRPRKFVQDHGSLGLSILTPMEALSLRRAERIYSGSIYKINYLRSIGINPSRVQYRTMGVDLDVFSPRDRIESRRRLGIDKDELVLFHAARFDYQKGTDVVLNAYRALKERFEKLALFMVGGSDGDPLYDEVSRTAKYVRSRIPHDLMPYCYSAADVTCYFWRPPALWYGGGGISAFESLACGTPVVSNGMMHLSSFEGVQSAGRGPQTETAFKEAVAEVLQNRESFRCREFARKYFGWDAVIAATLADYEHPLGKAS